MVTSYLPKVWPRVRFSVNALFLHGTGVDFPICVIYAKCTFYKEVGIHR